MHNQLLNFLGVLGLNVRFHVAIKHVAGHQAPLSQVRMLLEGELANADLTFEAPVLLEVEIFFVLHHPKDCLVVARTRWAHLGHPNDARFFLFCGHTCATDSWFHLQGTESSVITRLYGVPGSSDTRKKKSCNYQKKKG